MAFAAAKSSLGDDKSNFTKWTKVLAAVEAEPIGVIRETFDEFLKLFPLCYGYWEKYAAAERKAGSGGELVCEIYERSVRACPNSADIWLNYAKHVVAVPPAGGNDAIEAIIERGLAVVKYNPRTLELWRMLIKLRTDAADLAAVNKAYETAVQLPVSYATTLLSDYQTFARSTPVAFLTNATERAALESKVPDYASKATTQQDDAIKALVVALRKASHEAQAAERSARKEFETPLASRWFFHVTPVAANLRATWHSYLDWAEEQDEAKARNVYERCLVVCSRYPQFWLRFGDWERRIKGNDACVAVMKRATVAVRKGNTSVGVGYATALERAGNANEARAVYTELVTGAGAKSVEAVVNFANFERRQTDVAAALKVYTAAVAATSGETCAYLTAQLARLHSLNGDATSAAATFEGGITACGSAKSFWHAFADLHAASAGSDRAARVLSVYGRALGVKTTETDTAGKSPLGADGQRALWPQLVRFVEDNCGLETIDLVRTQYAKWKRSTEEKRGTKRGSSGSSVSSEATKKARTGPAPVQSVGGGYYGQQAAGGYGAYQYGYGYGGAGAGAGGGGGYGYGRK